MFGVDKWEAQLSGGRDSEAVRRGLVRRGLVPQRQEEKFQKGKERRRRGVLEEVKGGGEESGGDKRAWGKCGH